MSSHPIQGAAPSALSFSTASQSAPAAIHKTFEQRSLTICSHEKCCSLSEDPVVVGDQPLVLGLLWEMLSTEVGSGSLVPVPALTLRRIRHTSALSSSGISWRQMLPCSDLLPWHLLSGSAALSLSSCLPSLPSNSSWKFFKIYFYLSVIL